MVPICWPSGLARHVARNAPGFVPPDANLRLLAGGAISVVWILLVARLPRSPARAPANWAIGLVMLWSLAVVLLMPWFDQGRSYHTVVESLDIAVRGERGAQARECIATTGLPDAMKLSMDYFAGLRARPIDADATVPLDLSVMRGVARVIALWPSARLLAPVESVDEFGRAAVVDPRG